MVVVVAAVVVGVGGGASNGKSWRTREGEKDNNQITIDVICVARLGGAEANRKE